MRHLRLVSIAMTVAGVALVILSVLLGLGGAWTLSGLLLTVAGAVKIGMVALWHGVAGLGAPPRAGEDA